MSTPVKVLIAAVAVVGGLAVLAVGGTWVYVSFIRDDPPEELSLDDLETDDSTAAGAPGGDSDVDGTWTVTTGSEAGYRVDEVRFGSSLETVGRTDQVSGEITIDGAEVADGSFSVDLASVETDESQRDGQFRDRIMDVATYPTADFELTEPIDLGEVPAPGEPVTVEAIGELTVHGVTNEVTFEVEAVLQDGTIAVDGDVPIVWSDYDIPNPDFGPNDVADEGLMEFLLVFEPA